MRDARPPRAEEQRAREIVAKVLGARVERLDEGGGERPLADYLVESGPQGVRVPLEVTTAAVAADLSTAKSRQRLSWTTRGPTNDWYLSHTAGLKVRALHDQRRDLLLALEAAGIDTIDTRYDDDDERHAELRGRMIGLGLRRATAISVASDGGAEVYFGSSSVGTTAPTTVSLAVELEAWKDDNRAKLRPSGQLFVWIDSTLTDASAAMSFGVLPPGIDAPPEVSMAWVAPGPYRDIDYLASPVWRWTADVGWVDLGKV